MWTIPAKIKYLRIYMRILTFLSLVLLVVLGLFQAIWVYGGSETSIMLQSEGQRTRVQTITKDVMIMAYHHDTDTQAVGELQAQLPLFERTQTGLLHGDSSLQLPSRIPDDVAQAVMDSQSDFLWLDSAANIIVEHQHDQTVDPTELAIVLTRERTYSLAITSVVQLWQTHIDHAFFQLFLWETGLTIATILSVGGKYFFFTRKVLKRMIEMEESAL